VAEAQGGTAVCMSGGGFFFLNSRVGIWMGRGSQLKWRIKILPSHIKDVFSWIKVGEKLLEHLSLLFGKICSTMD
jgi:hypothetical protein